MALIVLKHDGLPHITYDEYASVIHTYIVAHLTPKHGPGALTGVYLQLVIWTAMTLFLLWGFLQYSTASRLEDARKDSITRAITGAAIILYCVLYTKQWDSICQRNTVVTPAAACVVQFWLTMAALQLVVDSAITEVFCATAAAEHKRTRLYHTMVLLALLQYSQLTQDNILVTADIPWGRWLCAVYVTASLSLGAWYALRYTAWVLCRPRLMY